MKKFLKPDIEFIEFSVEDVITTSSVDSGNIPFDTKIESEAAADSPAKSFDWRNLQWYQ